MKISEIPEFITADVYAEKTHSNYNAVLKKLKDGNIPAIKRNNRWLIPVDLVFNMNYREDADVCEAAKHVKWQ